MIWVGICLIQQVLPPHMVYGTPDPFFNSIFILVLLFDPSNIGKEYLKLLGDWVTIHESSEHLSISLNVVGGCQLPSLAVFLTQHNMLQKAKHNYNQRGLKLDNKQDNKAYFALFCFIIEFIIQF